MLQVSVVNKSKQDIPAYATGIICRSGPISRFTEPVRMNHCKRAVDSNGLFIEIPVGYEGQIRPRSGWLTRVVSLY